MKGDPPCRETRLPASTGSGDKAPPLPSPLSTRDSKSRTAFVSPVWSLAAANVTGSWNCKPEPEAHTTLVPALPGPDGQVSAGGAALGGRAEEDGGTWLICPWLRLLVHLHSFASGVTLPSSHCPGQEPHRHCDHASHPTPLWGRSCCHPILQMGKLRLGQTHPPTSTWQVVAEPDLNPTLTPESTPPLPPCGCWLCCITLSPPVKSGCPHSAVGMSKPQQSFTTFCVFPSTLHIEPHSAIFLLVTSLSWHAWGHVAAAGSRPHSSLQQPNHGGPLLVLNLLVSSAAPSASQNPPPRPGRSSHE